MTILAKSSSASEHCVKALLERLSSLYGHWHRLGWLSSESVNLNRKNAALQLSAAKSPAIGLVVACPHTIVVRLQSTEIRSASRAVGSRSLYVL